MIRKPLSVIVIVGAALITAISYFNHLAHKNYHWTCHSLETRQLASGVQWTTIKCQYRKGFTHSPWLKIEIVDSNLSNPHLRLEPRLAHSLNQKDSPLDSAIDMGAVDTKIIAGINGGYFFRKSGFDAHGFTDLLCLENNTHPPDKFHLGDSLLQMQGKVWAWNCAYDPEYRYMHYARSALILNGPGSPYIIQVGPYQTFKVNGKIPDAVGAGPGIISYQGGPQGILTLQTEGIFSTFEAHRNTLLVLAYDPLAQAKHVVFLVSQRFETTPPSGKGINDYQAGTLLLSPAFHALFPHLAILSAMGMDQGNSTELYVKGEQESISGASRAVYDGLFVVKTP